MKHLFKFERRCEVPCSFFFPVDHAPHANRRPYQKWIWKSAAAIRGLHNLGCHAGEEVVSVEQGGKVEPELGLISITYHVIECPACTNWVIPRVSAASIFQGHVLGFGSPHVVFETWLHGYSSTMGEFMEAVIELPDSSTVSNMDPVPE